MPDLAEAELNNLGYGGKKSPTVTGRVAGRLGSVFGPRPDRPRAEADRALCLAARGAPSRGSRPVGLPADVRPTGSRPVQPYLTCIYEG